MKRFQTEYSHLSPNYSADGAPVALRWTSSSGFKSWDFVCLDPQENPIARWSANMWAVKKLGQIEFMGEETATNEALREELMVMGLTLYYEMMYRINSVLALFGAVISRPGHDDKVAPEQ
jgi:hypothetical protein